MEISIVRLGCVSCGAALEIGQEVKQLACSHCGTSQIVERDGGGIHLKEFAHTLSRVQVGTDKTAAELALARLDKERFALTEKLRQVEDHCIQQRDARMVYWNRERETKRSGMKNLLIVSGIGAAVFGCGISSAFGSSLAPLEYRSDCGSS